MSTSTLILLVGLALTAGALVLALLLRRSSTVRRVALLVTAAALLVGTVVLRGAVGGDVEDDCGRARTVFDSAAEYDGWRAAAEDEGLLLLAEPHVQKGSVNVYYTLLDGERPIARWNDAPPGPPRLRCLAERA